MRLSLFRWLNTLTFGGHQSSSFTAKNEEHQRSGVFEYVCQCMLWANCTQFQKKEGLLGWVGWALTALPFIAALSFIQTHKGCVRVVVVGGSQGWWGALFVFPSHRKSSSRIGMCFRPHELSALCSQRPIQIYSVRIQQRGDNIHAVSVCLFLYSQVCAQFGQRIWRHTNPHAHIFCHLVWAE